MCIQVTALPSVRRDDVKVKSRRYQKNCQDQDYSKDDSETWDLYLELAKAAQLWKPNDTYNNLVEWHDWSFWNDDGKPVHDSYYVAYCTFGGTDGTVPRPDEYPADRHWDGGKAACKNTYAYSFRNMAFWWDAPRYYTVFCPLYWDKKKSLAYVNDEIERIGKQNVKIETLFQLRASTYIHEMTHHQPVSNPFNTVDDLIVSGGYRVYGPERSAQLAKWYGSATPVKNEDGGHNGEHGAAINAENLNLFALSVYFQEKLSLQAPFEPADGEWRYQLKYWSDPVPTTRPLSIFEDLSGAENNTQYANDRLAQSASLTPLSQYGKTRKGVALCVNGDQPEPHQIPFDRQDAITTINIFCSVPTRWDFQLVPPISVGTGLSEGDHGAKKTMKFDNMKSPDEPVVDNGIWLNVRFWDEECSGFAPFTIGTSPQEKTQYCTDKFMGILDNCQTNTVTAKHGGSFLDGCLYYQIQGRAANTTDNYAMGPFGALKCVPTDATILPMLKGTCTCSYENYHATDTFEMPPSGNCNDVDVHRLHVA
ncbi:hypothetical protein B0J14DRAFT_669318 [Halenospora varia]|nr:hypothetical protein B0J14DRAFT_669318 [Halenospora varia]